MGKAYLPDKHEDDDPHRIGRYPVILSAEEKTALILGHSLLLRLLEADPNKRVSAEDALKHLFFVTPLTAPGQTSTTTAVPNAATTTTTTTTTATATATN
jgi:hypothetical protein